MSLFKDPRMRPRLQLNRVSQTTSNFSQGPAQSSGLQQAAAIPAFQIRPLTPSQQPPEERPKAVFWDDKGRLLDDKGNIINLKQASELKINQKTQKDNKTKDLLKLKKFGEVQATSSDILAKRKFYDPTLDNKLNKRDRRKTGAFNFVQEGTFIKRGEILRKNQLLQEHEQMAAERKNADEKDEEIKDDQRQGSDLTKTKAEDGKIHLRNYRSFDPIPQVEWWDAQFLPPEKLDEEGKPQTRFPYPDITDSDIYLDKITHYIQHPKQLKNEYIENINKIVVPIHLTEKEKKKLRRMKRIEKEKDKQEKVKLGIMPAPLPKVKLSNYMKIMGKEAIADPSRVEQKVKQIVEKRLEDHLKRNADNKLTREQREAKMKRRHERDITQNECRIAVFKVEKLTQPHLKFKVSMNAQQFHMGGFCLIADQTMAPDLPNLVIVEGGPRAIKRFKKLMLRRIDWNSKAKQRGNPNGEAGGAEEKDDHPMNGGGNGGETGNNNHDEEMDEGIKSSKEGMCHLIWEGVQKKKAFEKWRVVDVRSENEAKRLLSEKGCEHFWNLASTFQPERARGEEPEQLEKLLE